MSEIKFRGWSNNEMRYSEPMPDFSFWKWAAYDSNSIIMLWSGLKDSKGVEIYAGDIFKYLLPDLGCEEMDRPQTYTEYIELVIFEDGQFGLEIMPLYAAIEFGEVIGNIYENPELIPL